MVCLTYNKICLKWALKKKTKKIGFQDQLSLNTGQIIAECSLLEHSAILSTFIKLPFVLKTFVLSFFKWPLKTGFTVFVMQHDISTILGISEWNRVDLCHQILAVLKCTT